MAKNTRSIVIQLRDLASGLFCFSDRCKLCEFVTCAGQVRAKSLPLRKTSQLMPISSLFFFERNSAGTRCSQLCKMARWRDVENPRTSSHQRSKYLTPLLLPIHTPFRHHSLSHTSCLPLPHSTQLPTPPPPHTPSLTSRRHTLPLLPTRPTCNQNRAFWCAAGARTVGLTLALASLHESDVTFFPPLYFDP